MIRRLGEDGEVADRDLPLDAVVSEHPDDRDPADAFRRGLHRSDLSGVALVLDAKAGDEDGFVYTAHGSAMTRDFAGGGAEGVHRVCDIGLVIRSASSCRERAFTTYQNHVISNKRAKAGAFTWRVTG